MRPPLRLSERSKWRKEMTENKSNDDTQPEGFVSNEGDVPEAAAAEDADFEVFEEDFGDGSALVQLQGELDAVKEELARARAETYNVRQEYANYVRRTKEDAGKRKAEAQEDVVETLLPVLDDVEASRAAGALADGPFAAIADKLEEILASRYGLEQFGAAGDIFDPMLHDALMANSSPDVEVAVINTVLQPGFKVGERVLRPTKVIVDNPA